MFAIYGIYGISVYAVRAVPLEELAQRAPLVRFAQLTLVTVEVLRAAGFRLEPTGRNPEHFTVVLPDIGVAVDRLGRCDHQTVENPYHEP